MMSVTQIKQWLSVAICCLPGIAVMMVVVGIVTFNGLGRQTMDINTLFLVVMGLACPVGMGLMMWIMNKQMNQNNDGLEYETKPSLQVEDRATRLKLQRYLIDEEVNQLEAQNPKIISDKVLLKNINPIMVQHESE